MLKSFNSDSRSVNLTILIGLFISNLFLKINFLGSEPFWYDEIVSVKASLLDFGHIKHMSEWDNNPPFYYYSLWVWVKLFGISEFKVRLLSVVLSSLSTCLLFSFLKKYFGVLTGLGAALMFTLHNFSYEYSHESRCYSLVTFLVLLSSICFFYLLEKKNNWSIFWLGLVNFLVIYTHYIAGIVIVFQLLIIVISKRDSLKQYAISIGICIGFVLLRFTKKQFLLMMAFSSEKKTFWLSTANKNSLYEAIVELFSGPVTWMILLLFFVAAFGLYIAKRKSNPPYNNLILLYSFLIGGGSILTLFIIGIYKPLFLGRYLLFTVPFLLIPISWLFFNNSRFFRSLILIPVLFEAYSLQLNPLKPMDLRTASNVVKSLQEGTNPLIIIQTKDITALFAYYFNNSYFFDYKNLQGNLRKDKVFEIENSSDLPEIPYSMEKTILFCQTFEKADDSKRIFDIFKQNNFVFTTTTKVKGVKISLLKKT